MTMGVGLVAAFVLGYLAQRLRMSPIVGYLAAGIAIGPFTPGFVGDVELAAQLSEIGVILLMFGVGLHFSLGDLLAVKRVAVPGAIVQMAVAAALGTGAGLLFGLPLGGSLLMGLALSVASTVVMLRALESRSLVDTRAGHISIGWLIVEDLAMVAALVIVPVIASGAESPGEIGLELLWTLVRVGAFVALMLLVGRRAVPWALGKVADAGDRELFTLAVLALGMGVAVGAAWLFDVSVALGAFFAGMVLKESRLASRAAGDSLPLRDAFAVLFFVAVGMLVDPAIVVERPLELLVIVLIIVVGKGVVAYALVRALKYSHAISLVVAASLAQIGEFSFILVTLSTDLGVMSGETGDLVLAAAIVSIVVNPFLFAWASRDYLAKRRASSIAPMSYEGSGHIVIVGHGRVGVRAAQTLAVDGDAVVVIDDDEDRVKALRADGGNAILGNAARASVLEAAGVPDCSTVLVAIPDPLRAGAVVSRARELSAEALIVARGGGDDDAEYLRGQGADAVLVGVHEVADGMVAAIRAAER